MAPRQPLRMDPCGWAQPSAAHSPHRERHSSEFTWNPGVVPRLPRDDGSAPHLPALKKLGLDGYLDAHTHWFPDNVNAKIWAYFDEHYWPVTYRDATDARVEWMRRNGVRRFTTLTYAHRPGMAEWLNAWTAELCARVPEAIPCATFYPEPEAAAYVRRAIEQDGVHGFKIHTRVGAFDPSDFALEAVFEQVTAAGLPVVLHVGDAPDAGPFTVPEVVDRLLARHAGLRLIIAHMGASQFEHYLGVAERYPAVALDTTMVFVGFSACDPFPATLMPRLEKISERVLFGSDFPTIPYTLSHAILSFLNLPLSDAAKRNVLWNNAARSFRLNP